MQNSRPSFSNPLMLSSSVTSVRHLCLLERQKIVELKCKAEDSLKSQYFSRMWKDPELYRSEKRKRKRKEREGEGKKRKTKQKHKKARTLRTMMLNVKVPSTASLLWSKYHDAFSTRGVKPQTHPTGCIDYRQIVKPKCMMR